MRISEKTNEMLNRLLQNLFGGNALIDNLYYNLLYKNYGNLSKAIHEPVAHVMGEWADEVSDLIDQLNGRSVRYAIAEDYTKEYGTAKEIFIELEKYFITLREIVIKILDELDGDLEESEVRIFMEDFLRNKVMPYLKQTSEWRDTSEKLDENNFNIHISDYTHYIK